MLGRIIASLAVVIATTFGDASPREDDDPLPVRAQPAAALPVDVADLVLSFGDALESVHAALAYEAEHRDASRVGRACGEILARYPALRGAVAATAFDLLVAAEALVDACRSGRAATLDGAAFEIVDGDYYAYRELSLAFAKD